MAAASGAKLSNNREHLIFEYDRDNQAKSYKGVGKVNYLANVNAVAQSSYTPWTYTTSGTWQRKHRGAIRAYNATGGEITYQVNSGVGDHTNTYHAIWKYDYKLKKPVIVMRDFDAQWKAKSGGVGSSFNDMGLSVGDKYTISWLQWVSKPGKYCQVGLYGHNTAGQNGFHSGQSGNSPTSQNTKVKTWERVYHTFTVSSSWKMDRDLNYYMYGHYGNRSVIKIADVQLEVGDKPSPFIETFSPLGTSERVLDTSGNNRTITAHNLATDENGDFYFLQANDSRIDVADPGYPATWNDPFTFEFMMRAPSGVAWCEVLSSSGTAIVGRGSYSGSHMVIRSTTDNRITFWIRDNSVNAISISNLSRDTWYYVVATYESSGQMRFYLNAEQQNSHLVDKVDPAPDAGSYRIGGGLAAGGTNGGYGTGEYPLVRLYKKALTAAEIKQNFEAIRGRFGI